MTKTYILTINRGRRFLVSLKAFFFLLLKVCAHLKTEDIFSFEFVGNVS